MPDTKRPSASTGTVGDVGRHSSSALSRGKVRAIVFMSTLLAIFGLYVQTGGQLPQLNYGKSRGRQDFDLTTITGRAQKILTENPVVDGHNDLLYFIRYAFGNHIYSHKFSSEFGHSGAAGQVDLPRIDRGAYGGAFWAAYVGCPQDPLDFADETYYERIKDTLSQIDTFNRLSEMYPHYFSPALSAAQAEARFEQGKLISPIAIEGLHQIGNSMSVLRQFYNLGVRYATLTHNCHNIYADAAVLDFPNGTSVGYSSYWGGVSLEGQRLIKEMNRMGMIVDLAHVSPDTMRDVLVGEHPTKRRDNDVRPESFTSSNSDRWSGSAAPPIISHSSAFALCPHPRNVPDSILPLVKQRESLIMVNFNPSFISCSAPFSHHMPTTDQANATLERVVDHIVYIGEKIGYDYVGIGSDFDGIPSGPKGAEDVSKLPGVVEELLKRGVSDDDAAKVVGRNLLRVWRAVDEVARTLQLEGSLPAEDNVKTNTTEAEMFRSDFPGLGE